MNKLLQQEQEYTMKYYGSLVGCEVIKVQARYDEYDDRIWPVIYVRDPKGNIFELEVSQDPEGNGPGFIFGLPSPTA